MKKIIIFCVMAGALVGVTWWLWPRPVTGGAEDTVKPVVSVHVAKVVRTDMRAWVDAYGTVESSPAGDGQPAGVARLSAPEAGLVMSVPVREGASVEAGTVIVNLDDRVALAQLRLAEQHMARQKKLGMSGGTSEKAVQEAAQQLATAQTRLTYVRLVTPIAGVVARVYVHPGQTVEPHAVVADVVDPTRLVAMVHVPACEAILLKMGQPAEVRGSDAPTRLVRGVVDFVDPRVDARTGALRVRLALSPDVGWRVGQFVHARVMVDERVGKLVVPYTAIYTDHGGQSTISLVENMLAKRKPVRIGLRDGNWVEVEGEGVEEGASVVTLGSYALPEEAQIKVINPL